MQIVLKMSRFDFWNQTFIDSVEKSLTFFLYTFYKANNLALSSKDIVNRKWAEIKTSMVGNQ